MSAPQQKTDLIAQLSRSREQMARHAQETRESLNVAEQLRHSIAPHARAWLVGAAAVGLIAARLLHGGKKRTKATSGAPSGAAPQGKLAVWLGVASAVLHIVRPAASAFLSHKAAQWAEKKWRW